MKISKTSFAVKSLGFASVLVGILLAACGEQGTTENITQINQIGMEVVSSVKELPKCSKDNEGEQALVKGETSVRVCVDGKWFATVAKDSSDNEFSCTTKELKDKSGLKIICNGDSIGVVLNGAKGDKGDAGEQGVQGERGIQGEQGVQGEKGEQGVQGKTGKQGEKGDTGDKGEPGDKGDSGKDGASCSIAGQTDSTVTIKCGEKSVVLNLGGKGSSGIVDTLELDSEKIAISLDTLTGFSQKGPFLKGSSVYLYELSDGRTLKQTNGNFTSEITSDDGRYSFQSRDLVSQYALIVVDGKYRNEVTGKPTTTGIKLQAYTNMLMRKSANVNLLTHLEKNRVFYLVTKKGMTVRAAKKQAQAEIFKQFHIDASGFKSESEDLDVFGKTDADAALLAISILLQGADDETALSVLLTEISNDMEKDGLWNEDSAAATKAAIADWALAVDSAAKLPVFSTNVTNWGLGAAPNFAKFVRRYASIEDSLGVCGVDEKVGTVKNVTNKNSKKYYAKSYTDTSSSDSGKTRFICIDSTGVGKMWRVATDLEKDRFNWNPKNTKDGGLLGGPVSGRKLVWDSDTLRHADDSEVNGGKGCTSYNRNELKILNKDVDGRKQYSFYKCTEDGWTFTLDTLNRGTIVYEGQTYKTIGIKTQMWMAENLNYEVDNSYCYNNSADSCAKYGRLYTWRAVIDSMKLATDADHPLDCDYGKICGLTGTVRGICPEGWHIPTSTEWETLYSAMDSSYYAMQAKGYDNYWPSATDAYGFSVLPAGHYTGSRFDGVGFVANFWSATESRNAVYFWSVGMSKGELSGGHYGSRDWSVSVRCVKDSD